MQQPLVCANIGPSDIDYWWVCGVEVSLFTVIHHLIDDDAVS